jgi:hypothetical protein
VSALYRTHGRGGIGVQRIAGSKIRITTEKAEEIGFSVERIGTTTLRFNLHETDTKARAQAWYNLSLVFEDLV